MHLKMLGSCATRRKSPGMASAIGARLEVLGEIERGDERTHVRGQVIAGVVVERPNCGLLDRPVHALRLPVGPGVVRAGELVNDAVLAAHAVEHMDAIIELGRS